MKEEGQEERPHGRPICPERPACEVVPIVPSFQVNARGRVGKEMENPPQGHLRPEVWVPGEGEEA